MFGKQDIMEARERLAPYIYQTPVLHLGRISMIFWDAGFISNRSACSGLIHLKSEAR